MKLPPLLLIGGAALAVLFQSGCATVTRGTSEQLLVQSNPSGAQVRLSNGFTGVTPASFTVPRKGTIVVTFTKDGYEPAQVEVKAQLSGTGTAGFLGNAIIGGVIGGGIDVATGATLSHTPNPVIVTLRPLAARPEAPAQVASPPAGADSEGKSQAPVENTATPEPKAAVVPTQDGQP